MHKLNVDELDQKTLQELISLVFKFTGISMNASKKNLLQVRLKKRLKELELSSYSEYLEYLKATEKERQEFVNIVTTNETYFFRTDRVWEYFANTIDTWAQNPSRPLKIWSAAASTGEEAFSIAMLCEEKKARSPGFDYQVSATDISSKVIDKAKLGHYTGRSLERIKKSHPDFFKKYFIEDHDGALVKDQLREKITFKCHNLFAPQPGVSFDIIFLRNVLIYFSAQEQELVLKNMDKALTREGSLIIGESESLGRLDTNFEPLMPLIYRPKKAV